MRDTISPLFFVALMIDIELSETPTGPLLNMPRMLISCCKGTVRCSHCGCPHATISLVRTVFKIRNKIRAFEKINKK